MNISRCRLAATPRGNFKKFNYWWPTVLRVFIREAAKNRYFFGARPLREGGGTGLATKKNTVFWEKILHDDEGNPCCCNYIRWYLITCCARMMENRTFRIKYPICVCSRNNQKLYTGQITVIALYVRIYLWVYIINKVLYYLWSISNISTMSLSLFSVILRLQHISDPNPHLWSESVSLLNLGKKKIIWNSVKIIIDYKKAYFFINTVFVDSNFFLPNTVIWCVSTPFPLLCK